MQFSLKQDFTEKFKGAMENWNLNDWTKNAKEDRTKAETDIKQKLNVFNHVTAISNFTSLLWWDENKKPINLRKTVGRPFKVKELYNSQ